MLKRLSRLLLIREDEHEAAYYFLLVFMLIGWGTAIGRGTADALFLKRFGVEFLPVMYTVLSPLLALASIAYAATADRIAAERLFQRLFLVLGAALLLCWLVMRQSGHELIYPVYFLVYEVVSEVLLIHAALYLSQNFETQQAKRLTSPIMAGSQLGTILGGLSLAQFSGVLGVHNMILAWLVSLMLAAGLLTVWHRRTGPSVFYRPAFKRRSGWRPVGNEVAQGIKLLRKSQLLRVSSLALFFMVIGFYVLCYTVHTVYNKQFTSEESLSAFYGVLVATTSACALLLQLAVTSRIIRKFGVRAVNLFFPSMLVGVFGALLLSTSLPVALLASFSKDTIMPAFRNPVRNLFFNVLPANIQGRARATSLIVVMPMALLVAGAFLWFVQNFDMQLLVLATGLGAGLLYLQSNRHMNKAYLAEIVSTLKGRLYVPQVQRVNLRLGEKDSAVLRDMLSGIEHPDEEISVAFADAMLRLSPEASIPVVLPRLPLMPASSQDRLIGLIAQHDPAALRDYLWQQHTHEDPHFRATALGWLVRAEDPRVKAVLPKLLSASNPRLRACAVRGIVEGTQTVSYADAEETMLGLLSSKNIQENIAGLELADLGTDWAPRHSELRQALSATVRRAVAGNHQRARIKALQALSYRIEEDTSDLLDWLNGALSSHDQELRLSAVQSIAALNNPWSNELLYRALDDPHPGIRTAAVEALFGDDFEAGMHYLEDDPALAPHRCSNVLEHMISLQPQHEGLRRLAEHWATKASEIATLRNQLGERLQNIPEAELVLTILDERSRDYLDLTLEAISPTEGREEVAVIRAALATGDRAQIATAREVLQNLRARGLAHRLDRLLAGETEGAPGDPEQHWQRLQELAAHSDEWFRTCVQRLGAVMRTA